MKRLVLVFSAIVAAQEIDAPPLAHVLDREGLLTPIHGIAGNFLTGRPGPSLLGYSNDGDTEWRLEPGRLSATRDGRTAVFATNATRAIFRGPVAVLPDTNETLRLIGDVLSYSSEEPQLQLAGRTIKWADGKLLIFQPDGTAEEVECIREPESMTAAAADWAYVVIDGRSHLLRLTRGRAAIFVLPLRRSG